MMMGVVVVNEEEEQELQGQLWCSHVGQEMSTASATTSTIVLLSLSSSQLYSGLPVLY